jgi:hypothetical protein
VVGWAARRADADAGVFVENVAESETSDGNLMVERGATD